MLSRIARLALSMACDHPFGEFLGGFRKSGSEPSRWRRYTGVSRRVAVLARSTAADDVWRLDSRLEPMSQTVRGVISRKKGEPVELVDIVVPDPGPGEAVVDIIACGVCHTDLTYREGGINDEYPFLLGHEAAGTVEAVGPGVTAVEPGDFVILNWRAVCGQCRACKRGRPQYCFDTFNAEQKMTLTDGTELTPALGIGAFADKTLVHAGQCTKVDPAGRPGGRGPAGLRGDGRHRRGDQHRRR